MDESYSNILLEKMESPKWRSLNPRKSHLKLTKGSHMDISNLTLNIHHPPNSFVASCPYRVYHHVDQIELQNATPQVTRPFTLQDSTACFQSEIESRNMRTAQIDFSMYQDFPAIVIPFIFEIDIMIKFDFRKQRVHVQMLFTFSFQKCWSNSSNYKLISGVSTPKISHQVLVDLGLE